MPNTYEFDFTDSETGSLRGCYIKALTPQDAWVQFEAKYPPRRYLVTAMRLFWDGPNNWRVTQYYDIDSFTSGD